MHNSSISSIVWPLALITSALGATILFDSQAGINWPIWVAATAISLVAARAVTIGRVERPLLILLGWATLLSVRLAVLDNEFLNFLVILSDAMLLGLAVITIATPSWGQLSAKLLATVPFLAPFRVWRASLHQAADAPRTVSSPRTRSLIRGALLSAPLVILLIALLGSADPVIRWGTDQISAWLPDWSFPPRLLFFLFLLSLTLGAYAIAASLSDPQLPVLPHPPKTVVIGITEQRMVLWSAVAVVWIFVLLQISYIIHPPPAVIGNGITFADYARRGFSELSVAATIVGAIILILEFTRPAPTAENDRALIVRLELALLGAMVLILLSAFRRVVLYEQAYGFTTARLFAQAYMVGMAVALIALALEVVRGSISINFARRVAVTALAVLTVMVFWNHEAWIIDKNVDRGVQTGKFDLEYARNELSGDALPTLLARRRELGASVAASIEGAVVCGSKHHVRRWFEWNRSAGAQRRAFESVHPASCPGGASLRWDHRSD